MDFYESSGCDSLKIADAELRIDSPRVRKYNYTRHLQSANLDSARLVDQSLREDWSADRAHLATAPDRHSIPIDRHETAGSEAGWTARVRQRSDGGRRGNGRNSRLATRGA